MRTTTAVHSKPKAKGKGKISKKTRRITIEPTDNNGFMVTHEPQPPEATQGQPYPSVADEKTSHQDQPSMLARINDLTGGGQAPAEPAGGDDGTPDGGDQAA